MKLTKLIFIASVLSASSELLAQGKDNSFDGIILTPSSSNENSFLFGEPFRIYFDIVNADSKEKLYYTPQTNVNYEVELLNLSTSEIIKDLNASDSWIELKSKFKVTPPPPGLYFEASDFISFGVRSGFHFGTISLSSLERKYHNSLIYQLRALPVGKYELTFKYFLFPSDRVLASKFRFEVLPVPESENQAFDQFIRSTEYAYIHHFWGDKKYDFQHPYSYDSFLTRFPESIYADYAILNIFTEIYLYPVVEEDHRSEVLADYASGFFKLRRKNVKAAYARRVPKFIEMGGRSQMQSRLDSFLHRLKSQDPTLSKIVIKSAEKELKIKGLKNYAAEENR